MMSRRAIQHAIPAGMFTSHETSAHTEVTRREAPLADAFDRLAEEGTAPLVMTGCLERWPLASELWKAGTPTAQIAVLERLIGHRKLHYTTIAPEQRGHLGYAADGTGTNFTFTSGGKVPFSQFAAALRATLAGPQGGAVYMQSAPLGGFPELLPQVPDLPYLAGGAEGYRQLWIGSGGHVVNLHFDPTHNLIAMLTGRKRVTLVPPDNMASMYPAPLDCRLGDAIGSQVTLLAPDVQKFPRAPGELAKAQVATLEPGDVLYIPPMWWHHVESFGLNVMLNKWVLPVSATRFTDITANIVRGILIFDDIPAIVRLRYRDFYHATLFASDAPPPAPPAVEDPATARLLQPVHRHVLDTWRVLRGVPPSLRTRLPQLYDYYVFQVDGPPALSTTSPTGFRRKLRLYAAVVGAMRAVRSLGRRAD